MVEKYSPDKNLSSNSVQMRVPHELRKKINSVAAVLDMPPGQVVDQGMDLYIRERRKDEDVVTFLGSIGLRPIEEVLSKE